MVGIEPTVPAWKAEALPLSDTCVIIGDERIRTVFSCVQSIHSTN